MIQIKKRKGRKNGFNFTENPRIQFTSYIHSWEKKSLALLIGLLRSINQFESVSSDTEMTIRVRIRGILKMLKSIQNF